MYSSDIINPASRKEVCDFYRLYLASQEQEQIHLARVDCRKIWAAWVGRFGTACLKWRALNLELNTEDEIRKPSKLLCLKKSTFKKFQVKFSNI